MKVFAACAATAAVFLILDMIWLGVIARGLYRSEMAGLIAPSFKLLPAMAFYVLYVAGTVHFAVQPGINAGDWRVAMWNGAFFGLVAYATYDLTNWAVLRDWPVRLTFIDLAWGTVLTAVAAAAGAKAALRWA